MVEEEQRGVMDIYAGVVVGYTQGTKESIDNARRPGRGSMTRPTINEESDCLRKKICGGATAIVKMTSCISRLFSTLVTTKLRFSCLSALIILYSNLFLQFLCFIMCLFVRNTEAVLKCPTMFVVLLIMAMKDLPKINAS